MICEVHLIVCVPSSVYSYYMYHLLLYKAPNDEIARWERNSILRIFRKTVTQLVNFHFSLWFSVISHVYYKGVEYCHLIGISLKIHEWALKKTLLLGGGMGIEKGFLFILIIKYPSILIRNFWERLLNIDYGTDIA